MQRVLKKSKETSLRRYETSAYDAENGQGPFGWLNMLIRQSSGKLSKEQFSVFRAIHQWRDTLARDEDESPLFIMGNATLFDITRRLPPDPKALHSLIDAKSYLARRNVSNLFGIITKAIANGANGPSVAEFLRSNAPNSMGVGEVVRTIFPQRAKEGNDIKDLVSHTSKLWGDVPVSSRWDPPHNASTPKMVAFELPWVQFLQSAKFADGTYQDRNEAMTTSEIIAVQSSDAVKTETQTSDPVLENSEFTLRAGIKRKAPENDLSSESEAESDAEAAAADPAKMQLEDSNTGEEEISLLESEDEKKSRKARKAEKRAQRRARKEEEKAERKNRKIAEKLAKKQAQSQGSSDSAAVKGEDDESDDEPFDYTKAKSVLNANKNNMENSSGSKGPPKKARFNQFSMANDGPKPARRLHGEKVGKSATFKK
jgi:exosome complex exonuclease RRP6